MSTRFWLVYWLIHFDQFRFDWHLEQGDRCSSYFSEINGKTLSCAFSQNWSKVRLTNWFWSIWVILQCNFKIICFILTLGHFRVVTGIFFWGGKVIFPDFFPGVKCFFPVENSHFRRPKTNFHHFQEWKAKKKKKKKRAFNSFYNFLYFHYFQFSTFPFSIFLLFFSIFTPFPFFTDMSANIFQSEVSGAPCPPACYATGTLQVAPMYDVHFIHKIHPRERTFLWLYEYALFFIYLFFK